MPPCGNVRADPREILEGVTTLAALGALASGAATLSACDEGPLGGLRPPPELLAKGLTSGLLWGAFCSTLEDAGEHVRSAGAPDDDLDRAEGYRMLTRLLGLALEMVVEGSDADRPAFFEQALQRAQTCAGSCAGAAPS